MVFFGQKEIMVLTLRGTPFTLKESIFHSQQFLAADGSFDFFSPTVSLELFRITRDILSSIIVILPVFQWHKKMKASSIFNSYR